jgi:hypothetical protein
MNVRFYPDQKVQQSYVLTLSALAVGELDAALRAEFLSQKQLPFKVLEWLGTTAETIDGLRVLVTEYIRGPVPGDPPTAKRKVRLFRVINGARSFTITVSYDVAASSVAQPLTNRIARSAKIIANE